MTSDRPYWWDAAPPSRSIPETLPKSADVVIVGAGFTGLSAALTLSRGGRSVVVCDAREIGYGASTRNGGHIGAKMRRGVASIASEHGEELAKAVWGVARASRYYLEDLIKREGIDCDFTRTTRFYGAHRPGDYEKLSRTTDTLRRLLQYDVEMVPRDGQSRYVNTEAYFGGMVDREAASFHPAKYIRGLSQLVQAAGGILVSDNKVEAITRQAGGFEVKTRRGVIAAKDVIVATNGYSGPATPEFARRIIPIGSYIIATEPLSEQKIRSLMPGCDLVIDTRRCASYMRCSPDRTRIHYGGRVAATDITPAKSGPRLKAVLDSIFPSLKSVGISHSWMGFTGFTFDELPHLGQHEGIYYAMGYCGSGTAMATFLGHKVAERILGHPDSEAALDGLPFVTKSFYRGNPWFLSTVIAYYRILDRFRL